MAGRGARSTKEETEMLRRRIWVHRSRGLTITQIARAVGKSNSIVSGHLKASRIKSAEFFDQAGAQQIAGEYYKLYREFRQEAARNAAKAPAGSPQRLAWLQEARQSLTAETKYMMEMGMLQKAPDKVNLTISDVRNMNSDEIERAVIQLQQELASTPIRGVTMHVDDDEGVVVNVPAKVSNAPTRNPVSQPIIERSEDAIDLGGDGIDEPVFEESEVMEEEFEPYTDDNSEAEYGP